MTDALLYPVPLFFPSALFFNLSVRLFKILVQMIHAFREHCIDECASDIHGPFMECSAFCFVRNFAQCIHCRQTDNGRQLQFLRGFIVRFFARLFSKCFLTPVFRNLTYAYKEGFMGVAKALWG